MITGRAGTSRLRLEGALSDAALWRRRAAGDGAAREELILRHLLLARHVARRYAGRDVAGEDLEQVARFGLIKAVDGFDPDRSGSFTTYAVPTIAGELRHHFRDRTWAVHVPRDAQERALRVTRAIGELTGSGRVDVPTLQEATGLSDEDVIDALHAGDGYVARSFEEHAPGADEGDSLGARLTAPGQPYERVERLDGASRALAVLSERERQVVALRFLGELSQSEIAERIGVSQMQVSRILRRAVERASLIAAAHDR